MKEILDKILKVSNITLDSMDTNYINPYNLFHNSSYFHLKSGTEHYRLLMYVSTLIKNDIIFDVGTYRCVSSIALSYSGKNVIKSYDIRKDLPVNPIVPRCNYLLGDATKDIDLNKSNIIFLDVAHDGTYEDIFYAHLHDIKWSGILLLDDIHLNDPMKKFWENISEEKYDISNVGHWSGTGLVYFP